VSPPSLKPSTQIGCFIVFLSLPTCHQESATKALPHIFVSAKHVHAKNSNGEAYNTYANLQSIHGGLEGEFVPNVFFALRLRLRLRLPPTPTPMPTHVFSGLDVESNYHSNLMLVSRVKRSTLDNFCDGNIDFLHLSWLFSNSHSIDHSVNAQVTLISLTKYVAPILALMGTRTTRHIYRCSIRPQITGFDLGYKSFLWIDPISKRFHRLC
jgi:hypothetical protein